MDPFKHKLTFRREVDGILYVTQHPSIKFFISKDFPWENQFLVEPLTINRFARAVITNFVFLNYWKIMRFLIWRLHAFKLSNGQRVSWRDFKPYLTVQKWIKNFTSLF